MGEELIERVMWAYWRGICGKGQVILMGAI